jgi:hypothetical protein
MPLTRIFRGPSSFASDLLTASTAVNRPGCRSRGACRRADVDDDAAVRAETIYRLLRTEDETENIEIEQSVEMLFRHGFERQEFVNTGVVDQDVETTKCLLRLSKQAFDVRLFRHVGLHRNGFSAFRRDFGDDGVSARLAGRIVDDNSRARVGQMLGDRGADAFGRARDDSDFAGEYWGLCVYGFISR